MPKALILLGLIFVFALISCSKEGTYWQYYRISALDEAQKRDMTIFLHFNKKGACEKQVDSLEVAVQTKIFEKAVAYRVELGKEKRLEKNYSIKKACSFLVFKGKKLRARSVGVSELNSLLTQMKKAL